MKETGAALRYAKATLNFAKETKKEAEVNNSMILIAKTIRNSKELSLVLKSPVIKTDHKLKAIKAIFSKSVDQISIGIIRLLGENKRLSLLETVSKQYSILFEHNKLISLSKVTTAVPLTKNLKEKFLTKIKQLTGNEVRIENIVNPNIIGGFILRVGDIQYDASILNNFNKLKKQFDNSHYIAKV